MPQMLFPALTNPMMLDSFTVNRRQQSVNNFGESSTAVTPTTNVRGVVYPSDENDLRRLADIGYQAKAITVITRFALRGASETGSGAGEVQYQPDVVVWNGDSFIVRLIEDMSNYGPGFVKALCSSMDSVDQPPVG